MLGTDCPPVDGNLNYSNLPLDGILYFGAGREDVHFWATLSEVTAACGAEVEAVSEASLSSCPSFSGPFTLAVILAFTMHCLTPRI